MLVCSLHFLLSDDKIDFCAMLAFSFQYYWGFFNYILTILMKTFVFECIGIFLFFINYAMFFPFFSRQKSLIIKI